MKFNCNKLLSFLLLLSLFAMSCGKGDPLTNNNNGGNTNPQFSEWLINRSEVLDGGPGKDGIPSVDSPEFANASMYNFIDAGSLVDVVSIDGEVVAYPHNILDWHEIVNDKIGDKAVAITYCPLTGTGIAWDRAINGEETTFGVSGLLYNTNLMPYDRKTNSTWSQIRQDCVNGENIELKATQIQMVEMNWSSYKSAFPQGKIMTQNTGFERNYSSYPYGDYRTNNDRLIFPLSNSDSRIPLKNRVLGVLDDKNVIVFTFSKLAQNDGLINIKIGGRSVIVFGDAENNYMNAMEIDASDADNFSYHKGDFPNVLKLNESITYDLFGNNIDDEIDKLKYAENFIGYYLSFPSFFDEVEIFE